MELNWIESVSIRSGACHMLYIKVQCAVSNSWWTEHNLPRFSLLGNYVGWPWMPQKRNFNQNSHTIVVLNPQSSLLHRFLILDLGENYLVLAFGRFIYTIKIKLACWISSHHDQCLGSFWAYKVGQDPSDSKSSQLHVDIFRFCFHSFEINSIDSSKIICKFPKDSNFNWLCLGLNWFICN